MVKIDLLNLTFPSEDAAEAFFMGILSESPTQDNIEAFETWFFGDMFEWTVGWF